MPDRAGENILNRIVPQKAPIHLIFNSEAECKDYLKGHKISPCDDNELYCMQIFLGRLLAHGKYPIDIEIKRECPDFVFRLKDITIGLEHTQASCRTLTYGMKKIEDYPEGSMLEIPDCQRVAASKESIKTVIRKPGKSLQSSGWGDWGKEKFLIEEVLNSIKNKTTKLNQNYEIFPSNELIIYDNISIPGMSWDYVMPELKRQYVPIDGKNFDKIHFVTGNKLRYDIMSECD